MPQVAWERVDVGVGQSIQGAIDILAAANGGKVYLVPGIHEISATLELPYPGTPPPTSWYPVKPISLLGDGPNATIIKRATGFTTGPMLRCRRSYSSITGIAFDGAGSISDAIIEIGGAIADVRRINFRDVIVRNGPFQCVKVLGGLSSSIPITILNSFDRCVFANNGAGSLFEIQTRNTTQEFHGCQFTSFRGHAVKLILAQGVSFYDCMFDTAKDGGTASFLHSDRSSASQLVNCVFDEGLDAVTARQWFVELLAGSNGWTILGTHFIRRSALDTDAKAILIGGAAAEACYGVLVADPIIRVPSMANPPGQQIKIERHATGPHSECVVLGGYVEAGSVRSPIALTDDSLKTAWISHRRWRMPQVSLEESQLPGISVPRLGDMITRTGQGLEARTEATAPGPSGIPLTVNRYANLAALQIPPELLNLGTIAWVNNDGTGNGALMLCIGVSETPPSPPHTWKKITLL